MKELDTNLESIKERVKAREAETVRLCKMLQRLEVMQRAIETHNLQVTVSLKRDLNYDYWAVKEDLERICATLTPLAEQIMATQRGWLENQIILEANNAA